MINLQKQSKALTASYKAKTLPTGWYYFSCAGTKPQIGKYIKPTDFQLQYAAERNLPEPAPTIYACPGIFTGALDTITILAPVPAFEVLH